jgi:hypothetical protein
MSLELAEVIGQLRAELVTAMAEGEGADLRFQLGSIDVELSVAVTKEVAPGAKIKFWVVEAGVDTKLSSAATQKIKLQLDPRQEGRPGKPLISGSSASGER